MIDIDKVKFDEKQSIINISDYFSFTDRIEINKDYFDLDTLEELSSITINDAQDYKDILGKIKLEKKKLKLKLEFLVQIWK